MVPSNTTPLQRGLCGQAHMAEGDIKMCDKTYWVKAGLAGQRWKLDKATKELDSVTGMDVGWTWPKQLGRQAY